jgi:hypothetical protein
VSNGAQSASSTSSNAQILALEEAAIDLRGSRRHESGAACLSEAGLGLARSGLEGVPGPATSFGARSFVRKTGVGACRAPGRACRRGAARCPAQSVALHQSERRRPDRQRGPSCPGAAAFDSGVGLDIVAASHHSQPASRARPGDRITPIRVTPACWPLRTRSGSEVFDADWSAYSCGNLRARERGQVKAEIPVRSRPTISDWIVSVPS